MPIPHPGKAELSIQHLNVFTFWKCSKRDSKALSDAPRKTILSLEQIVTGVVKHSFVILVYKNIPPVLYPTFKYGGGRTSKSIALQRLSSVHVPYWFGASSANVTHVIVADGNLGESVSYNGE